MSTGVAPRFLSISPDGIFSVLSPVVQSNISGGILNPVTMNVNNNPKTSAHDPQCFFLYSSCTCVVRQFDFNGFLYSQLFNSHSLIMIKLEIIFSYSPTSHFLEHFPWVSTVESMKPIAVFHSPVTFKHHLRRSQTHTYSTEILPSFILCSVVLFVTHVVATCFSSHRSSNLDDLNGTRLNFFFECWSRKIENFLCFSSLVHLVTYLR